MQKVDKILEETTPAPDKSILDKNESPDKRSLEQEPNAKDINPQVREICKISKIVYDQFTKNSDSLHQITEINEDLQNENIKLIDETEELEEMTNSLQDQLKLITEELQATQLENKELISKNHEL